MRILHLVSAAAGLGILAAGLGLYPVQTGWAQSPASAVTDPAEIDRAVAEFTGAEVGEVGGARMAADRRLRLAACDTPLEVNWHGTNRSTVAVQCAGPEPWRIFIATRAAPQAARAERVVSRGDPMTIMVRGRGFSVQQTGEAMESGAIGDWIAIRTTRRGDPVRARIERPGLAVIPAQ